MEVTKSFHITGHLPDVFCFEDNHSVWASQEKSLKSFADIEGPSDEKVNGIRSEMLTQRNDDDCIFLSSSPVNYPRNVLYLFDRVHLWSNKGVAMLLPLDADFFIQIHGELVLQFSNLMQIHRPQCWQQTGNPKTKGEYGYRDQLATNTGEKLWC